MNGPLFALALAAVPEILLPPWPLLPDGELVAVRGADGLSAEGATVEPVGRGLFRVVPREGAGSVRLAAGSATAVASVEPPPAEIAIEVSPRAPVKGRDRAVTLELAVRDGGEDVREPEIVASSGRVHGVVRTAPGRFRAVYEPAATRHPEVAVLLALVPRCPSCATPRAVGQVTVPVSAAIDLPGRSEPGVRTTVTIAGRRFGPAVGDTRGRFTVPVVIPPGAHSGTADSVDAIGNQRRTEIDLQLPPVDRLACAAWPRAMPADGSSTATLWCVASGPGGEPAADARLVLSTPAGVLAPPAPFRGALQRAAFRAPRGGGGREVVISAAYPEGGAASVDRITMALASGPPTVLAATVAGEPVALGATVPAETAARDANGDLVGRPAAPPGSTEGFVAPDRFVARRTPGDYVQRAPLVLALAPGTAAASLSLHREGEVWVTEARTVDGRPAAGVALRFGSGAAATTDERGEARVRAAGPRETVRAENGARAAGFEGFSPPARPFEIAGTVAVALRPPAPVDVSARVEGGFLRWRVVDPAGRALAGRNVEVRGRGVELGPPERDGDGGRARVRGGRGTVAVVDADTGIAAVVEVP